MTEREWGPMFRQASRQKPGAEAPRLPDSASFGGVLPTGPGDVLAYRAMWDPYVMGALRAISSTADAFNTVSAHPPPGYTAQTLSAMASSYKDESQKLLVLWNSYAGLSPDSIVLSAGDILNTYQDVVRRVGHFTSDPTFQTFHTGKLPPVPSESAQRSLISHLEGASMVARGVLSFFVGSEKIGLKELGNDAGQLVGAAAAGAGAAAGAALPGVGDALKNALKDVPWWAWAAGGTLVLGAGAAVLKASPLGMVLRVLR
jgi:hypothetical protein